MYSFLERFQITLASTRAREFAYIHAYMLWSFTCIVSRGEEENRSRHPHLANRVIARTLFFSEPP